MGQTTYRRTVSVRELIVLGTASREGLLFDLGEGTQRQMLLVGVSVGDISRIRAGRFAKRCGRRYRR